MVTPAAKRKAVAHLCDEHQVSQRRACNALQVDRSTVRYRSVHVDDLELRDAIKRVSRERRRFGYRRIHVMIEREGHLVNHKKLRRIYQEEKLQVRRRGGRKRALGTRKPMVMPDGLNQSWSLDFVSDAFTDGRRFRILTVVDDFTRENLALVADTSLSRTCALEEMRFHLMRGQPVMPSKIKYRMFELEFSLERALQFPDLEALASVGHKTETFGRLSYEQKNDDYPRAQEIGEVAHFLDFDGSVVPSARSEAKNVIVFCDRVETLRKNSTKDHGIIDWSK